MNIVASIAATVVLIGDVAGWTDWKQERRRLRPISWRIRRVARKHRGQTGLVVQIFWPVAPRGWNLSVDSVSCWQPQRKLFGGSTIYFWRSALGNRRPFWVPMKPDRYRLTFSAEGKRPQEKQIRLNLGRGEQQLMLCWPAKRRVVTRERQWTVWQNFPLPPTG
ncbi:MAG TPA: hypothetical protein VMZ22_02060 [Acidimicrobiales bacterium]|nr:hypothetical protein [Acidimicrobiales bacterium]